MKSSALCAIFLVVSIVALGAEVYLLAHVIRSGDGAVPMWVVGAHLLVSVVLSAVAVNCLPKRDLSHRGTYSFLFLLLTALMPLAGAFLVSGLYWILASPTAGRRFLGDSLVFGIPARRGDEDSAHVPTPFVRLVRERGTPEVSQALLGLRHVGSLKTIAPLLQRFQQDPDAELQFFAQGSMAATVGHLEQNLRAAEEALAAEPEATDLLRAVAEYSMALAGSRSHTDPTREALYRDALVRLDEVARHEPGDSHIKLLAARCALEIGDESRAACHAGSSGELELELLFRQGDWGALAKRAAALRNHDPEIAGALQFWSTQKRGVA